MEQEKHLSFLKPIWKAKRWNFNKLKSKSDMQILAIYLNYHKDLNKINKIIEENKEYVQLDLFSMEV